MKLLIFIFLNAILRKAFKPDEFLAYYNFSYQYTKYHAEYLSKRETLKIGSGLKR